MGLKGKTGHRKGMWLPSGWSSGTSGGPEKSDPEVREQPAATPSMASAKLTSAKTQRWDVKPRRAAANYKEQHKHWGYTVIPVLLLQCLKQLLQVRSLACLSHCFCTSFHCSWCKTWRKSKRRRHVFSKGRGVTCHSRLCHWKWTPNLLHYLTLTLVNNSEALADLAECFSFWLEK